jgi:hypothetical protein
VWVPPGEDFEEDGGAERPNSCSDGDCPLEETLYNILIRGDVVEPNETGEWEGCHVGEGVPEVEGGQAEVEGAEHQAAEGLIGVGVL